MKSNFFAPDCKEAYDNGHRLGNPGLPFLIQPLGVTEPFWVSFKIKECEINKFKKEREREIKEIKKEKNEKM